MSQGREGLDDKGARKYFQRLRFDETLSANEYTIGWMEPKQHAHRKSGAEAWSLRIHDVLQEVPYAEFLERFQKDDEDKEDIPYHRIAYFKIGGVKTWENEYHRKKAAIAAEAAANGHTPAARRTNAAASKISPGGPSAHMQLLPPHPRFSSSFISSSVPMMRTIHGCSPSPVVGGPSTEDSDLEEVGGVSDDDIPQWQLELDEEELQQGSMQGQEEEREVQLPEACWMAILCQLNVRDVCMTGRVNRWLRQLANTDLVWKAQYRMVMGAEPPPDRHIGALRRLCRRSALRAARWLEADIQVIENVGFLDSTCLQLDDSKAVSADASVLRLWSHTAGRHRRIATLPGHAGRVTSVVYNEEYIVSGCTQSVVKVWSMDDLKCRRTLRGHEGAITGVLLTQGGIPVSSSEDGRIRLWDISTGSPISDLDCHAPVLGLATQDTSGYLVSTGRGGVQIWDLDAATLLHTVDGSVSLQQWDAEGDDEGIGLFGAHADNQLESPFSCVAYNGNLLAAGRAHEVVLWDSRTQHQVGCLQRRHLVSAMSRQHTSAFVTPSPPPPPPIPSPASPATASPLATAAAEAGQSFNGQLPEGGTIRNSSSSSSNISRSNLDLLSRGCSGVQLDEWKLAVGFGSIISLHDIRTAGAAFGGTVYKEPFLTLQAPAKVNCFQFHQQQLLAGLENQLCCLWSFQPPPHTPAASHIMAEQQQQHGGLPAGALEGDGLYGQSPKDAKGKKKEKKKENSKKQGRFPKRTTK